MKSFAKVKQGRLGERLGGEVHRYIHVSTDYSKTLRVEGEVMNTHVTMAMHCENTAV